jgi:hypothetical protein
MSVQYRTNLFVVKFASRPKYSMRQRSGAWRMSNATMCVYEKQTPSPQMSFLQKMVHH